MPRVAIREFTTANPIYAGCTAEFWTVSAGVKTAVHADLYRGATGSSKHANPITLDSRGMSSGPIYIEAETICTVGGLSVSDHDTGIITPGPSFRVDQTTGKFQYSFDAGSSWNDSGDYIFKHRGTWLTGTAYNRNDTALSGGNLYLCLEGHTAGVFATDLAASKWLLFLDLSANVVITSATEPAAMFAHMLWADTANDLLKIRNASNTSWVSLLVLSTGATAFNDTTLAKVGKQTLPIPAVAMTIRSTSGPASGTVETAINKVMVKTLDFDQSLVEYAQFAVRMPKAWNEGTVTAEIQWSSNVSGTNSVVWGVQGVAIGDDDALDAAFGTGVTVTDAQTAQGDLMKTAETSAITLAGSPAAGDWVVFQVYRDAGNGSDTLAGDARLHGVTIFYTTDGQNDA